MGRHQEAESLDSRTFEARERILGAEHPDTLSSMNNLAVSLESTGRHQEAEDLYRKALQAQERSLGVEHPDTLLSNWNLAILLLRTRRCCEAWPLLGRAWPRLGATTQAVRRVANWCCWCRRRRRNGLRGCGSVRWLSVAGTVVAAVFVGMFVKGGHYLFCVCCV